VIEPKHYYEAVKDPRWRDAMKAEIRAIEKNEVWSFWDLPSDKKTISCKWVYRVNYNSDGNIERFKPQLVIHGDHQVEGFDYNEMFAPMAKMTSVQCLLTIAVSKG